VANSYPLYTGYTSYSRNLTPFAHVAEYSISYTNDPRQVSGCSWEYTTEINKDGRYYNVSENGSILGHGIPQNDGYNRAKNLYPRIKSGVSSRIQDFYTNYVDTALTLKKIEENQLYSQFNGNVEYNFAFSDNPIHNNGVSGVKTQQITINDSLPTQMSNSFEIFNTKEIVQQQANATLGNRTIEIELSLTRTHSFNTIKQFAKNKVNENIPDGSDVYINNINYTYSPTEKKFSLNASWNFQDDPNTVI
jgi:hypothetical protein